MIEQKFFYGSLKKIMKKKINFCLLVLAFCSNKTLAQTNTTHLSKEQQIKDSIEFAKFKQTHPEEFLNERLPLKLLDGSYVVSGFSTGIQIKNNHVKDSVYHNFHPGMPDTSTVIPFNDIKVIDKSISINLFSHLLMTNEKKYFHEITSLDQDVETSLKIGHFPIGDFSDNLTAIKISINGKLLFDWKAINKFPKQLYKTSSKFDSSGKGISMFFYSYGYNICDTSLNINDQLLIEIKNTKNNWMIDRYNITRVAALPDISAIIPINEKQNQTDKNVVTFSQKKISLLNQIKEK